MDCVKSVPSDIVTGAIISLGGILIRLAFNECSDRFFIIKKFLSNLSFAFNKKTDSNLSYQIITSPSYRFSDKKPGTFKKSSKDSFPFLFFVLLGLVAGVLTLKNYQHIVQFYIYAISLFFISSGIFFIIMSAVTNKIQKSTLIFSIFSVLLSFYTYYNANILPTMVAKIPSNFGLKLIVLNSSEFFSAVYMFLGIIATTIEIGLVIFLFLRMFVIKVDSIKSTNFLQHIIIKTEMLDKFKNVLIMFIILTALSYFLTSGIVAKYAI